MGRIFFSICALVVAMGLVGASPPVGDAGERATETNQVQQPAPEPAATPKADDPERLYAACSEREANRHSDLCAQWYAADSAYEASIWTRRTGWFTGIGIVVGAVTMVAAIGAALFAKEAANHTKDGTEAAWATEKAARDGAEKQLRAYLNVTVDTWRGSLISSPEKLGARCRMSNHGATPAKGVVLKRAVRFLPYPLTGPLPDVDTGPHQVLNIWPNAPLDGGWAVADRPFTDAELKTAMDDTSSYRVYVFGSVTYQDVFGAKRRTDFCVYADPLSFGAGPPETIIWAVYPGYNDFT